MSGFSVKYQYFHVNEYVFYMNEQRRKVEKTMNTNGNENFVIKCCGGVVMVLVSPVMCGITWSKC